MRNGGRDSRSSRFALVLTLVLALCGSWVEAQSVILQDGFESYPVGSFPASGGWSLHWNGAGDEFQRVDDSTFHSGTAALRSTGSACWAAGITRPVSVPAQARFEAQVLIENIVSCGCTDTIAHLGVVNLAASMTAGRVHFGCDGWMKAETQTGVTVPLMQYSASRFYHVAVEYDFAARTFDVLVDGEPVGQDLPILEDLTGRMPNEVLLGAAHGASPTAWFDEVSLREMAPPCLAPDPDMVDWWPADRHAGDIARGNEGFGMMEGGVTFGEGWSGAAFDFDGAAGSLVQSWGVPDFGHDPFSVDFWLNSRDSGSNTYVLGKSLPDAGEGWDLRLDEGRIQVVGVNGWGFNITSDPLITSGAWHHIALSAGETEVRLWIDGALAGSSPRSALSGTDNPFRLGHTTDFGGTAFDGLLDEVAVYRRALSESDVAAIHAAGRVGRCRPPVFSLDAGLDHVCGIRADGSIACFGGNHNGQASPPGGRFAQVACGSYSTCGVRADGTVACWGYSGYGLNYPPDGPFRQVDVGFYHACGVRADGTVACWGGNPGGQTDSPAGTFKEVRLGWDHSCGIRTDGTLACWGANDHGQSSPPAGAFTRLSAGGRTSCALDATGAPTCWGYSSFPLTGPLAQISVGTLHRCGLRKDGAITCVGGNMEGPGQPPQGGFLYLTSNDAFSCGARADSTLVCWGKNDKGQAPRLAFSPTSLPPATLGTPYSESITVTASAPAAAPYAFELVDGELPPGLGFTDNGDGSFVIEGTPTSPGSFYPAFRVVDSNPDFPMAERGGFAIEIGGYTLQVYRDGAGSGTVRSTPSGIDCGSTCSAPYVAGTAVALTATPDLNSTFDRWTGHCLSDGSVVMDGDRQCTASFSTFAVSPSDANYYGVVGALFHQQFEPLGGFGTITWSVDGAPAGLVMDPSTGVLAGTPAEAGVFALTVTAADERGGRATISPTLTVECTLIEVYPPPSVGRAGASYSHRFYQSGASSATWSLEGALPTGLGFSVDEGLLSGTPLQPGSFPLTVRATDGYGCSGAAAATLTIENEIIIVDPSGTIPGGVVGTPYVQEFTQAGAIGVVEWSVVGQPPPGLTLGATTGVLSGTPAGSGAFTFTVVATDANGVKGEAECSLAIEPAPLTSVLRIRDAEVIEGDAGTVTVSLAVVLAPSAPGTVTLQYATANGTAVAGSDYTAATGTLTFAPGETSKTVSVSVTGDTAIEADETFFVRLSSVTGAYVADAEGKATILNDDSVLQSPPFGVVDTPANGATGVEGAIGVTGWALDDTGVARVVVSRDPVAGDPQGARIFIGDGVFVAGTRPDVAAAFPTYPSANRAGWGYMLLTNMLPNQGNGTFKLWVHAIDREGQEVLLGTRTITCSNAAASLPFGTLDTPGQGATTSGTVVVFGWALTPLPGAIPTDGSTIQVFVDGAPVGHPVYNQYRSDIATLFPGHANSDGAVGYYVLDTTTLANGIHSIAWSVTDDRGRSQGIGSRYFWVDNELVAGFSSNRHSRSEP